MSTSFAYKARDREGHLVEGALHGDSRLGVAAQVRDLGYIPVSIEPETTSGLRRELNIPGMSDRVKGKDLAVFSRQFATMIDSGLPLVRALEILGHQTESKPLRHVVDAVRREVEQGSSLSDAMAEHPKVFNRLYVAMVRAGEAAGVLDEVLDQLAGTLEKQVELRRKITSALTYPVAVLALVGLIVVAMLLFVVPTFKGMYSGAGVQLPLPTRLLLSSSDLAMRLAPFLAVGAIVGVVLLRRWLATPPGRAARDTVLLRIPVVGALTQKAAMSRFSRTLAVLLRSGVPILDSLQITSETVDNAVVARGVLAVQEAVQRGDSMHEPLLQHDVFPPMVTHMLAVGEETGSIEALLGKVAQFYDQEVETTVATLTSLLEPALIVVLGLVVGGMVVALYLPMFHLVSLVK